MQHQLYTSLSRFQDVLDWMYFQLKEKFVNDINNTRITRARIHRSELTTKLTSCQFDLKY